MDAIMEASVNAIMIASMTASLNASLDSSMDACLNSSTTAFFLATANPGQKQAEFKYDCKPGFKHDCNFSGNRMPKSRNSLSCKQDI